MGQGAESPCAGDCLLTLKCDPATLSGLSVQDAALRAALEADRAKEAARAAREEEERRAREEEERRAREAEERAREWDGRRGTQPRGWLVTRNHVRS